MQLFSSANCDSTRVNIIVLSVLLQRKTKHCRSCVKWGCRALLCDINQLFMPMKLQNIYLAPWYTGPRPQKTNRRLYQRRIGCKQREWKSGKKMYNHSRDVVTFGESQSSIGKRTSNKRHITKCLTGPYALSGKDITQILEKAKWTSWSNVF